MQRLRSKGSSLFNTLSLPQFRRKRIRSWAAAQDTYFSVKDLFERHKVVFTIGTSMASVGTAWAGYSLRHFHESRINERLESIEKAMQKNSNLENAEIKKLVDSGNSNFAARIATIGTAFIIGYAFGWRGGRWFQSREFRREQVKLLGQVKPRQWPVIGKMQPERWEFQFLRRRMPLLGKINQEGWKFQSLRKRITRSRSTESTDKTSQKILKDTCTTPKSGELHQSC